jgi:hypothetical protein
VVCFGTISFILLCLRFVDLLGSVDVLFSSNLEHFKALFIQTFKIRALIAFVLGCLKLSHSSLVFFEFVYYFPCLFILDSFYCYVVK